MNIKNILTTTTNFLKKHSTIISCIGTAIGVSSAVILAIKDTPKVNDILKEKKDLKPIDKVKVYAKGYWKSIAIGITTICFVGGVGNSKDKQLAGAVASYTIIRDEYTKFKETAKEVVGETKVEKIRQEVAKKSMDEAISKANNSDICEGITVIKPNGTLFFDKWSGRLFRADMETVRRAENDTWAELNAYGYVDVNSFYYSLGLENCTSGEFGWNREKTERFAIFYDTMLANNGEPCTTITFKYMPYSAFDF